MTGVGPLPNGWKNVPVPVSRGDTQNVVYNFGTPTSPFPISGYTFSMDVFLQGSSSPFLTRTSGSGMVVDTTNNVVTITFTATETLEFQVGSLYFADLKVVFPDSTVRHVPVKFTFNPFPPVTP